MILWAVELTELSFLQIFILSPLHIFLPCITLLSFVFLCLLLAVHSVSHYDFAWYLHFSPYLHLSHRATLSFLQRAVPVWARGSRCEGGLPGGLQILTMSRAWFLPSISWSTNLVLTILSSATSSHKTCKNASPGDLDPCGKCSWSYPFA